MCHHNKPIGGPHYIHTKPNQQAWHGSICVEPLIYNLVSNFYLVLNKKYMLHGTLQMFWYSCTQKVLDKAKLKDKTSPDGQHAWAMETCFPIQSQKI